MYILLGFVGRVLERLCGGAGTITQAHGSLVITDHDHHPNSADLQNGESVDGSGDHSVGSSWQLLHRDQIKYDLFINHRGPDTKKVFVTHLEQALSDAHYAAFVDKSVEEGRHAFQEITLAIHDTPVHLAIFSPNYAASEYCLDELVDMVKCQKKNPSAVTLIPIFYNVEPKDVRRPSAGGPFKKAFQNHVKNVRSGRYSAERISGWKEALHYASMMKGFELVEFAKDTNMLKINIVRRVHNIIRPRSGLGRMQVVPRPNVGGEELIKGVVKQLEEMGDNVAILGICGMGGIGKTTLAQGVYNHYSMVNAFRHQTFLKIDRESNDVRHLQRQALRELLHREEDNVVERYVESLKGLVGVKVLIVIDDISSADHFGELIPNMKKLGAGSRVILTSREEDTLRVVMREAPFASYVHKMQELNSADSCELFCFHAFENKELPRRSDDVFRPLAVKVAGLCGGLPLALKVIGQHLFRKEKTVWENATKSMRDRPAIIDVLGISYKGLPSNSDKMMFLDVAFQMIGLLEEDAIDIWKSCEPCRPRRCSTSKMVHDSLQILKDKSLVEVDKDNKLTMHDLLREMGKKIVFDEWDQHNRQPRHLWDPLDAKEILDENKGTEEIRGLSLVGLRSEESYDASAFQKMTEVHLLQLDGARIEGDFSPLLRKIRWLQWRSSFLTRLPSQLQLQNLAILDLSNSSSLTRIWSDGDTQVPTLLRVLRLQKCTALEEIPESIKLLTMLRTLNLQGCKALKFLPGSLGELQGLLDLNLNECENLESLPDGMVSLSNLKTFSMNGCSKITDLPVNFGDLLALVIFSAQGATRLTCLPELFSRLSCLEELVLSNCRSLSELPKSVKGLIKLRVMSVHETAIKELPNDFGDLGSLVDLNISHCYYLQCLPESFGKLALLKILSLGRCTMFRKLSSNFGQLQSLTDLSLDCCPIEDGDLPLNFGSLKRLSTLHMQQTKMTTLPDSFRDLTALARLYMRESLDLVDVEALPAFIEELELGDCPKLIDINLAKLTKLRRLILTNCAGLTDVQGLEFSEILKEINVTGCSSLSSIYENLLFRPTVQACFLSGSDVCLKYNNDWSQAEAASSQVVSYYDHAIGFVDNTMTRMISSVQDANEVCMETRISSKESSVEAVVITVVAHDQGWSDFPYSHGQYNGNCNIAATIVRSDGEVPVFASQLFTLRHADYRDQVYICTLRKSHPLVERLQDGDKICVIARSLHTEWRITVMQGSISVAYDKPDLGFTSDVLKDLFLKDGGSNMFRPQRVPHVIQAFTEPRRLAVTTESGAPDTQLVRAVCLPSFQQSDPKAFAYDLAWSMFHRYCDICDTPISCQRGWHCNTCDDFDMCQTCYTDSESATLELPSPHGSDHPMSVFEAPDPNNCNRPILMPYDGKVEWNWGYVVYDYPNMRWFETFDLNH